MNTGSVVTINLVVMNGERYLRGCLESVMAQTYDHGRIAINILANPSTDKTVEIIEELIPKLSDFGSVHFTQSSHNHGMWGGHEELWKRDTNPYLVVLSADVILHPEFIAKAVLRLDGDARTGALQGKIYQFDPAIKHEGLPPKELIDTCGFKIFRSRRVINIGHGEKERGQYDKAVEVFGVEGAVPVFRRKALESIRILGEIADHDLFWYAEDLDVAWRIRLAGWEEWYDPELIAWHDRQTTKKLRKGLGDFIAIRKAIPLHKRRLEWRNIRWTIIKNDYIINLSRDLLPILVRELTMVLYLLIFEPGVLAEMPTLLRRIPRMLRKRRAILSQATATPQAIHKFFH